MTAPVAEITDFDSELEIFQQKCLTNRKTLQKILSNFTNAADSISQFRQSLNKKSKDDIAELEKRVESIRINISNVHGDKDRVEQEIQQLMQDLEHINVAISEKITERDELKEKLDELKKRVKEKEEVVVNTEKSTKESMSNIERGALLFQSHLGLNMKCTNRNTLLFIFTQVNRSKPNEEYILELTIEGQKYRLLRSVPEISNLQELENKLNETNNFSGCIVHIRKLYQKMQKWC